MIRHTVLFKLKKTLTGQEVQEIFIELQELKTILPGILSIAGGECIFHEAKSEQPLKQLFTHGFSIDFEDQNALNQFFTDPVTHPIKDRIVDATEGGYDAIIGFDFRT